METLFDIITYTIVFFMILALAYAGYRLDKIDELKREPVGKRVKVMKNGVMVPGTVMLLYCGDEALVITDRCGAVVSSVEDLEPLIF